jgi:inorganic pyrophosphatase
MSLHNVTPGAKAPDEFNVIIEIPMNADPIKYEVDHETGALFVDRFMSTAMHYPCNYGYMPDTLSDDGDPVDVLVITPVPLIPGVVVTCRPLGMLRWKTRPAATTSCWPCPSTRSCRSTASGRSRRPEPAAAEDHPALLRALQGPGAGKWVKVLGWEGPTRACRNHQWHAAYKA